MAATVKRNPCGAQLAAFAARAVRLLLPAWRPRPQKLDPFVDTTEPTSASEEPAGEPETPRGEPELEPEVIAERELHELEPEAVTDGALHELPPAGGTRAAPPCLAKEGQKLRLGLIEAACAVVLLLLLACNVGVLFYVVSMREQPSATSAVLPAEVGQAPISSSSMAQIATDSPQNIGEAAVRSADLGPLPLVSETSDASAASSAAATPQPQTLQPKIEALSLVPPQALELSSGAVESVESGVYTVALERQRVPIQSIGGVSYHKSAYWGTVLVGSPPKPFKVVFDTGSGHLILPSTYCHSETCRAHTRYRRSQSKTAVDIDYDGTPVAPGAPRDQITVSFGTGEVTGVFIEDIVCIDAHMPAIRVGDDAPLPKGCMKLRLIAATEMSKDPFINFNFDGVLGLGLDGLSQTPEFNFFDVIAQAVSSWGSKMPHTFAVFLAEADDEASEITFGGWLTKHLAEEPKWNAVLDPEMGHWAINVRALRVGNETLKFCHEGCKAVVDTGTSLLAVPSQAFPEIYELLKHSAPLAGHCQGAGPELHLELDSFTVTLEPRDYARTERRQRSTAPRLENRGDDANRTTREDLFCKPMLMSMDLPEPLGPKLFILGEPILRKYYTIYDGHRKSVGFGRAVHRRGRTAAQRLQDAGVPVPKSIFGLFRARRALR